MKHYPIISVRSLQMFAEGGAAGGSGTAQGTGVTAPDAGVQKGRNPLADVKYGVQKEDAPVAEVQTETTKPKPDRKAEFEKLIKGEFKDLYDERMQSTIRERLRGQKETVERYEALVPSLEILAQKYGVDPTDAKALSKAIEEDDSFFATDAMESGTSAAEKKRIWQIERENARLRQQVENHDQKEHAAKQYATWMQQAEEAKSIYPQLDLEAEVKNPQFMRLLNAGVDVGSAYLVLHKDEVIPAAMQHVAQQVEDKLAGKIAAGGGRPAENGMKPHSGPVVKSDVSTLTKADRAEINRRVMNGEKISFS